MSNDPLISIDDAPDDVARKLIGLLAMASGNGATEAEMQNAMALAQRMALKHRIDLATINMEDAGVAPPPEEMTSEKIVVGDGPRRPPADRWLIAILMDHYNVEVVYHTDSRAAADGGTGSKVSFIGRKSDVAFAIYAYGYMLKAFSRAWHQYKRKHGAPMSRRASFYYGVYSGLDEKLRQDRGDAERELLTDSTAAQYGLAVIQEKDAREAFKSQLHPVLRKMKTPAPNIYHSGAVSDGRDAGRNITIAKALK